MNWKLKIGWWCECEHFSKTGSGLLIHVLGRAPNDTTLSRVNSGKAQVNVLIVGLCSRYSICGVWKWASRKETQKSRAWEHNSRPSDLLYVNINWMGWNCCPFYVWPTNFSFSPVQTTFWLVVWRLKLRTLCQGEQYNWYFSSGQTCSRRPVAVSAEN